MEYKNKKGVMYYLHGKVVTLRGSNRKQQIYYFAKSVNVEYRVNAIPEGLEIAENAKTGLPCLRRIK